MNNQTQNDTEFGSGWMDNPVWVKCECDKGNRWTFVRGGLCDDTGHSGGECYFSGCNQDHKWHIVGETKDRNEAHAWFRSVRETGN